MSQKFEWDAQKAIANLKKHKVPFDEALTVFANPLARIVDDPDHLSMSGERLSLVIRPCSACSSSALRNVAVQLELLMLEAQQRASDKNMKRRPRSPKVGDDLRPEYDFDYSRSRPNRFAAGMKGSIVTVVLEPDVAEVFDSAESVNRLLRSVIAAIPKPGRRKRADLSRRKTG